jgi:hypothetical protein
MPALAGHGLTLEAMAELYRQAGHAGVLEDRQRVTGYTSRKTCGT